MPPWRGGGGEVTGREVGHRSCPASSALVAPLPVIWKPFSSQETNVRALSRAAPRAGKAPRVWGLAARRGVIGSSLTAWEFRVGYWKVFHPNILRPQWETSDTSKGKLQCLPLSSDEWGARGEKEGVPAGAGQRGPSDRKAVSLLVAQQGDGRSGLKHKVTEGD